jgi:non-canonical purine NTP pyrophosphatase (RdgB/HAM1 family)
MRTITIVTGNPGKLKEWRRLFPADFQLETADIDLDEIQSMDLEAIVVDKAQRAYAMLGKPVVVEDVSAGLDKLGGLPGPFIKYFELNLGMDALFQLTEHEGDPATVVCMVAYYDDTTTLVARGDIHGSVVSARGENGFGFDKVFMPDGHDKTYGEMAPHEKDAISHRSKAIRQLVAQLNA